jgi:hypothetical protein
VSVRREAHVVASLSSAFDCVAGFRDPPAWGPPVRIPRLSPFQVKLIGHINKIVLENLKEKRTPKIGPGAKVESAPG